MPDKNEPPSEAEIQEALQPVGELSWLRGKDESDMQLFKRVHGVLSRALRSERDKAKRIEADYRKRFLGELWATLTNPPENDYHKLIALIQDVSYEALRSTPPEVKS